MHIQLRNITVVVFLFVAAMLYGNAAHAQIKPEQIIDAYERTCKAFDSQISKSETWSCNPDTDGGPKWFCVRNELRKNGERFLAIGKSWGKLDSKNAPTPPEEYRERTTAWDGEQSYHYTVSGGGQNGLLYLDRGENAQARISENYSSIMLPEGSLNGYVYKIPMWEALRKADRVQLRPERETVGESSCYIVDAEDKTGKYTLWFDPDHGYHIAKATIVCTVEEYEYARSLSPFNPKEETQMEQETTQKREETAEEKAKREKTLQRKAKIEALVKAAGGGGAKTVKSTKIWTIERFEEVGGVWVPMEAEFLDSFDKENGETREIKATWKRNHIDLNPDFEKVSLKPSIPDGTRTAVAGERTDYLWHEEGLEVAPSLQRPAKSK